MLEITPDKIAQVILQAREVENMGGRGSRAWHEFHDFVAALNEDEQAALVAVMWIGRGSFAPDELAEAVATARQEKTTPTEDYLLGEPSLAEYL